MYNKNHKVNKGYYSPPPTEFARIVRELCSAKTRPEFRYSCTDVDALLHRHSEGRLRFVEQKRYDEPFSNAQTLIWLGDMIELAKHMESHPILTCEVFVFIIPDQFYTAPKDDKLLIVYDCLKHETRAFAGDDFIDFINFHKEFSEGTLIENHAKLQLEINKPAVDKKMGWRQNNFNSGKYKKK